MSQNNVKSSIIKDSILKNCIGCTYISTCSKFTECEFLQLPKNNISHLVTATAKQNTKSSHKRRMSYGKNNSGDGQTTLHRYHAHIVNDVLSAIRAGKLAYVYTKTVLKDVKTYEPNINAEYIDGIFHIMLT